MALSFFMIIFLKIYNIRRNYIKRSIKKYIIIKHKLKTKIKTYSFYNTYMSVFRRFGEMPLRGAFTPLLQFDQFLTVNNEYCPRIERKYFEF